MKSKYRHNTELFEIYCKNTVQGLQVPKIQHNRIIGRFSKLVVDKILETEEVKLPIIGTLRVKKVKQKFVQNKMKVDWKATKESGKVCYHMNEDREGYFYRFSWRKNKIKGVSYYSFVPERYNLRRRLAKFLKENPSADFFES